MCLTEEQFPREVNGSIERGDRRYWNRQFLHKRLCSRSERFLLQNSKKLWQEERAVLMGIEDCGGPGVMVLNLSSTDDHPPGKSSFYPSVPTLLPGPPSPHL